MIKDIELEQFKADLLTSAREFKIEIRCTLQKPPGLFHVDDKDLAEKLADEAILACGIKPQSTL